MDLPTTHYDQAPSSTPTSAQTPSKGGILTKISSYLFLFTVFFSPLVFIPSVYAPLDVVKAIFLGVCILASVLLYSIDALKARTITLPHFVLGYSMIAIIISILVSSFASSNILKSFFGQGFEIGTASFLLLMFLASYLVSRIVMKDHEMIFKIYTALLASFALLALFQLVRIAFGPGVLSLGFLSAITSTILGRWYDFGILAGVMTTLSLLGIKFLPLRKGLKRILGVTLVVSLAFLFIVNSVFIWVAVALTALAIGIYEYLINSSKKGFSRISIFTLVIFILAVACAWKGNVIATPVVKSLKVEYGEVVLPWQLTLDVTADTLKESPLLGAGPNRFVNQYLLFKPVGINQSQFWNSEFTTGFGFIPTFVVTQGLTGGLLWILFLVFFVREGMRALKRATDPLKKFFVSTSFFTALFLWIIELIYTSSHVVIFLTFVFTGIFLALIISEGQVTEKHISSKNSGIVSKLTPAIFSLAIIVLIVWLGVSIKKAIAITYFQKGIKELNVTKSPEKAQEKFKKALLWDTSDVYYQAMSEINILKINTLAQELQTAGVPDQAKADQVIALIGDSVKYTKNAEKIDPKNYYNYLAEARIAEIGASLKIANAYDNAKNAYASALQTNPYNPGLYLGLARLEAGQNKLADAQQYIGRALQLKNNYSEAAFLLSQIQVAAGQIQDAITSTQFTIQLNPNEPLLYFQLGLLEYNNKNYSTAILALEKAVSLNNQYANARYFLGLSYSRMGRNADAIAQFEELAKTNADNKEVAFILTNLKEGKSPFADAKPPIDAKPEKRKTLPVTEKVTEKKTIPAETKKTN